MFRKCQIAILGGGISGLSLAIGLLKRGFKSFLLLEQNLPFGGYAGLGWMKIGLLPAGQKTADFLSDGTYIKYASEFLADFSNCLQETEQTTLDIDLGKYNLSNKYYKSLILPRPCFINIIESFLANFSENIVIGKVIDVKKNNGIFELKLDSGEHIFSEVLAISSGRNEGIFKILNQLGEDFNKDLPILFGCRACFDSFAAEQLFRYQADFRILMDNGFETYCFNYRGELYLFRYGGGKVFSGFFNPSSKIGNSFIGKRIDLKLEEALKIGVIDTDGSFQKLEKLVSGTKLESYVMELRKFVKALQDAFGLTFLSFHFPALEQFWPTPLLKYYSLESINLPGIFYLGDASGVAYGVLQSYITAMIAVDEILSK